MRRLLLAFLTGFVAGWWRREDPFLRRADYGYYPPGVRLGVDRDEFDAWRVTPPGV